MFGKVELPEEDYKEVIILAKEGISSRSKIASLKHQLNQVTTEFYELKDKFTKLFIGTSNFKEVMRLAPQRVEKLFSDIFKNDRESRRQNKLRQKSSQNIHR